MEVALWHTVKSWPTRPQTSRPVGKSKSFSQRPPSTSVAWFILLGLHKSHKRSDARCPRSRASKVTDVDKIEMDEAEAEEADAEADQLQRLQTLQTWTSQFQELQRQWLSMCQTETENGEITEGGDVTNLLKAEELMQREADLREDVKDCCYGDPAHTWIPVNCEHPVVSAHSDVTRALIKSELAKLQWMLKSAEALGHEDLKSEQGNFADLLLKMAELTLRLFDVARCYELLQRAKPLVGVGHSRHAVLGGLMDNCMMCECLKTTPSLTGDILPGNDATKTLGELGRLLTNLGYNMTNVTQLTGAESLIDFSNDDLLDTFSQRLAIDVGKGEAGSDLTYLIRLFLLRTQEGLNDLSVLVTLVGVDCCKILLQLQIITAVRDGCLLSIEDAIAALTEQSSVKASCFSNVTLWPLQNLIIATDAQTWPCDGFEPVMYLSDDSLALLDASPEVAGLNLLDMCCGSGVQGISAMAKKAASVTFSDVNPRALQFVRVNLAINGLLSDSCHFYLGNAFSSLRDGDEHGDGGHKFDAILANPPFLPNPDGIASQAIALYGNGGAFGEDVLSSIVEGCCHWLVDGGWLLMVTYAPNVRQMPQRLQEYLQNETAAVYVAAGNEKNATDFIPAASEVEAYFYPKALKENGIETLAETLVFIRSRSGKQEAECSLDLREELFADQSFLQDFGKLTQKALEDTS